jgi:hypothetical protein
MLGLLIGLIQAYIFAILATFYIAAALRSQIADDGASDENESSDD